MVGSNIVFSDREFQPHTDNGKKLLGHELVHVLQQSNPNMSRGIYRNSLVTLRNMKKQLDLGIN
jgi:hypothetical protein